MPSTRQSIFKLSRTRTRRMPLFFSPTLILQDTERRAKLWKSQKPTTMVVTILALGLRKLRAELRRRTDAWKIMATIEYPLSLSVAPPIHNVALSLSMKNRYVYEQPFNLHLTNGSTQEAYNISALCVGPSPPSKQQYPVFDPLRRSPPGSLTQGLLAPCLVPVFPSTPPMVSHGEMDSLRGTTRYMLW